jgi:hypothetical protein
MGGSSDDDGDVPMSERPEEFVPAGASGDDLLTRNLKRVYEQVAAEPVPEHLLRLLDKLDARAKANGDG